MSATTNLWCGHSVEIGRGVGMVRRQVSMEVIFMAAHILRDSYFARLHARFPQENFNGRLHTRTKECRASRRQRAPPRAGHRRAARPRSRGGVLARELRDPALLTGRLPRG